MKVSHMIIAGAVVIGLLVVACAYFGLIDIPGFQTVNPDDAPDGAVLQSFSDRDIFYALQVLTNKTLPYTQTVAYISALNMEMYGIDGQSAYTTWLWYKEKNLADGYASYNSATDKHDHWTAYHEIWYKDLAGRGLSVGDGASIESAYGYDTVFLTSHGPVTTYYDFFVLVSTS